MTGLQMTEAALNEYLFTVHVATAFRLGLVTVGPDAVGMFASVDGGTGVDRVGGILFLLWLDDEGQERISATGGIIRAFSLLIGSGVVVLSCRLS